MLYILSRADQDMLWCVAMDGLESNRVLNTHANGDTHGKSISSLNVQYFAKYSWETLIAVYLDNIQFLIMRAEHVSYDNDNTYKYYSGELIFTLWKNNILHSRNLVFHDKPNIICHNEPNTICHKGLCHSSLIYYVPHNKY